MMIEPELAYDDKADQPGEELRQQTEELLAELRNAVRIMQLRYFELENEQRDDDREHPVAESLDAGEPQLALRKAREQSHGPSSSVLSPAREHAYEPV